MKNCPCCFSTDIKDFIRNIVQGYDLIKCNSCEVVFANPFKEPSIEFYTNASDVASTERHSKIESFPKHHPANKCPQLLQGQGQKILDLGCGNGAFIDFVEKRGFECYGLDIDQTSITGARSRNLKAKFENGFINDLERFADFPKKFDIITMFEVFEHIDNPLDVISKIGSLLTDNGYFIGSLPNIERFKMWKYNMDYERPPYHLTYWTTRSWQIFVEKHQFTLITAENSNYFGYISDVLRNKYTKKGGLVTPISYYFFALTKYFAEMPVEKLMKNGAGFFFVAQKNQK